MAIDNGPTGMAYPIPDATELRHSSIIVTVLCWLHWPAAVLRSYLKSIIGNQKCRAAESARERAVKRER